jgi:hypothetical protein
MLGVPPSPSNAWAASFVTLSRTVVFSSSSSQSAPTSEGGSASGRELDNGAADHARCSDPRCDENGAAERRVEGDGARADGSF